MMGLSCCKVSGITSYTQYGNWIQSHININEFVCHFQEKHRSFSLLTADYSEIIFTISINFEMLLSLTIIFRQPYQKLIFLLRIIEKHSPYPSKTKSLTSNLLRILILIFAFLCWMDVSMCFTGFSVKRFVQVYTTDSFHTTMSHNNHKMNDQVFFNLRVSWPRHLQKLPSLFQIVPWNL